MNRRSGLWQSLCSSPPFLARAGFSQQAAGRPVSRQSDADLTVFAGELIRFSVAVHYPHMSGDVKICPKCHKTTLEPTLHCVVPPEMIRLLKKPIFNRTDTRVMPYFCSSCHCVELYPVGTCADSLTENGSA